MSEQYTNNNPEQESRRSRGPVDQTEIKWVLDNVLPKPGEMRPARASTEIAPERQRELLTHRLGILLGNAFDAHSKNVTHDEDGTQRLSLKVDLSASKVPAHFTSRTDENGVRTAFMWLQSGKALGTEMYKYTDGPDVEPSLEPYTVDQETAQPIPRMASSGYDPNDDAEVVYWGRLWADNIRFGKPMKSRSHETNMGQGASRTRRAFGRLGLNKSANQ